jgi:uncharacterized YccA/Bax inhibitor family protein
MANPIFNQRAFERADHIARASTGETMSVEGAINKSAFLLLLTAGAATWVWARFFQTGDPAQVMGYLWVGLIGGVVACIATVMKPDWARLTAPAYAVLEGLALGAISGFYEAQFHGLVLQAIGLTFGVLAVMLMLYRSGVIKVTDRFRMIVFAATGGIALFYFVTIILSFFHVSVPFLWGGGTVSIVFSLIVVGIAAMNLAIDFDMIAKGVEHGAPKFMEWYAAFALMVTLIWLYLEILRLLGNSRRR